MNNLTIITIGNGQIRIPDPNCDHTAEFGFPLLLSEVGASPSAVLVFIISLLT